VRESEAELHGNGKGIKILFIKGIFAAAAVYLKYGKNLSQAQAIQFSVFFFPLSLSSLSSSSVFASDNCSDGGGSSSSSRKKSREHERTTTTTTMTTIMMMKMMRSEAEREKCETSRVKYYF
jgi:hypothetical protein